MGHKEKPVRWIQNSTSNLLFVTPGDHKRILIIHKIGNECLFTPASLSLHLLIFPAMKWTPNCPCFLIQLPPPSFWWHQWDNVMITHLPSHVAKRRLFEIAHVPYAYFIPPSITVEAMNNTYFIILLQVICNTWNRMQYAVYLHALWTQGASVASVGVTRQEGKKGEQRKQAPVTPDSPSTSWSNYSPSWGTGCRSWWCSLCVSTFLNKRMCNFQTCLCALYCFWTQHYLLPAHVSMHLSLMSEAKSFVSCCDSLSV